MENLNRIKGALADAGKTGVWLAGQLGKDPVTVSKWCTNTTQPDLQTLAKISELLKINLKSASNLNGNLNCSKELEHYAS